MSDQDKTTDEVSKEKTKETITIAEKPTGESADNVSSPTITIAEKAGNAGE